MVLVTINSVSNCYNLGNVSDSNSAGGVAAYANEYTAIINKCYSKGNVSGGYSAGGIAGIAYGNISNCYSTGQISGGQHTGGIVGLSYVENHAKYYGYEKQILQNCFFNGKLNGSENVGGIIGKSSFSDNSGWVVDRCFATGEIIGYSCVGGVLGTSEKLSEISNSLNILKCLISDNISTKSRIINKFDIANNLLKNNYSWNKTDNDDNPDNEISWSGGKTTTGKNGADVAKSEFWGSSTKKSFWIDKLGWTDFDDNWEFRSGYNLPQLKGLPSVPDPDYLKNAN